MKHLILTLALLASVPTLAQPTPHWSLLPKEAIPVEKLRAMPAQALQVFQQRAQLQELNLLASPFDRTDFDNPLPIYVDVINTDVEVTLDMDQPDTLEVYSHITLLAVASSVSNVKFTCAVPNLDEVVSDREIASVTLSGTTLSVAFVEPLPAGELTQIDIRLHGPVESYSDPMLDIARLSGDIWYVTHSQFMPTRSTDSDVFTGTMRLIVRGTGWENRMAGGTGTLVEVTDDPEQGTRTFVFDHIFHTSLFAFSVGDFQRVEGTSASGIPLSVVVTSEEAPYAQAVLDIMKDVMSIYADLFVPYPWNKLDAVAMPNSFSGGFGPLSTIMMMQRSFEVSDDGHGLWIAMQLVSHEMGHQWWGNFVEMLDDASIFLSEGLAEFSSNLFVEKTADNRYSFASNNMSYVYTVDHDAEVAMVSPFVYISPYYYQLAYQKGACVADLLRWELGEELFLQGVREFLGRYERKYASAREFFDVMEEFTQVDLQWFWDQWMDGTGLPVLQMGGSYDPETGELVITARQEDSNVFRLKLPVVVTLRTGEQQEAFMSIEGSLSTLTLSLSDHPTAITIDPRFKAIRRLRPLLPGDLDLNGVVDGRDLVEMSFAYKRDIVTTWGDNEYFIPNTSYVEMADLVSEDGEEGIDGKVGPEDLSALLDNFGAHSEPDNENR